MSENVELVRLGLELFEREGPEALLPFAGDDVEVRSEGPVGDTGTYHGHDGFMRWSRQWLEAWESFRMETTNVVEIGDNIVVVFLHQFARGRASGVEVETDVAYLLQFHDGKVTRFHLHSEPDKALAAARELV